MNIARIAIAVLILAATSAPASAFYFPGWPGATRPPQPSLLQMAAEVPTRVTPPVLVEPPDPTATPEPMTLVMAGLGLSVWMLRRVSTSKK